MYHKHQTEGMILKGYDAGDSSKKVALLTRDLGLVYAHVQNGRGLKSKLRGSVQEYSVGKFVLVKGAVGWKLVGGEVEQSAYQLLKREPAKLKIAANVLNLARALLGEGSHAEGVYRPLKDFILSLNTVQKEDEKPAEYAILLKILHELGYLSPEEPLDKVISNFDLGRENLEMIKGNKRAVVAAVNQAIQATSVRIKI